MMDEKQDDTFDPDSLLSLLAELQQQNEDEADKQESDMQGEDKQFYPGMVKIAKSAIGNNIDGDWADDIIEDTEKAECKVKVGPKDITEYSKEIYSDAQLSEIKKGIDNKVNVELFADEQLSGRQMREIRYGLERDLDVSLYSNKFFRERQMQEIRIGLQDSLDVSSYARIIYSATDMRKKRMALFNEKYADSLETLSYDYDDISTGIHVYVEPGLMEAGIILKRNLPDKFTKTDLKNLMNAYDITEGFVNKELPQNLSNLPTGVKIVVMRGKPAVEGKDGWYEYNFPIVSQKPVVKEDGTVDYYAVKNYGAVKIGDVVATYHPAEIGEPGLTVTNIVVNGKLGKDLPALSSKDIEKSENERIYISKKEGFVSMQDGEISIMANLEFNGDLNTFNGRINFDGNVLVNGAVREGAQINATGDITITGYVESARLVSGRDIVIGGGVNSDANGLYVAKRNIVAGFFENAHIDAGGDIEAGYLLNCDATSGGEIVTKGKRSMISGGIVRANKGISTAVLGSKARNKTILELGCNIDDNEQYMKCIRERDDIESQIIKVREVVEAMQLKLGATNARQNESFLKLQSTLDSKKEEKEEVLKKLANIEAERIARNSLTVQIANEAFENSVICINNSKLALREDLKHPIFTCEGRNVVYKS